MVVASRLNSITGAAVDDTLRYYALFRYPLIASEVHRHCPVACPPEEVTCYLQQQEAAGRIYRHEDYYATSPDVAQLVQRRKAGNLRAVSEIPRAMKAGRLIYAFPFVTFVGISGSLSKGYSDEQTDFDFFIVTRKNRLWISRTLLHLFKKLTFLTGKQHSFCMNYFVDESALEIAEQNIYTATELHSLLPVCGADVYRRLMQANSWIGRCQPNHTGEVLPPVANKEPMLKRVGELLISILFPTFINKILMRLTDAKWRRKWARKGFPTEDYELAFRTTVHISKNHPANYQKKILEALSKKNG